MTIDKCVLYGSCKCQTAGCVVLPDEGCPAYRYFKDLIVKDYENRLKADLKAILVELQTEMEEYEPKWVENDEQAIASCRTWEDLDDIIQQKINALRGEK